MKKFYLLVLTCVAYTASAQYTFTALSGQTYTEITNPTYEIPDTSIYWGNVQTRVDMYFTSFGKQYDLYDYVYIPLKEGYAYFNNTSRSTTLYAAKGNFDGRPGAGQTSVFSFKLDTVGGPKFIVQWKNMGFEGGDENDYINFQLWLYENTGVVEMHYGPTAVKNGLWENNANGPTVGLLEMDDAFSTIYNRHWLTGSASSPVVSNTGVFQQMSSVPANGTVYRFAPGTTGIHENPAETGISIFPTVIENSNHLNINFVENTGTHTVKVYDLAGRLVKEQNLTGTNNTLPLADITSGTYFISLEKEGRQVQCSKIVKLD
jgi:hypothetical protein